MIDEGNDVNYGQAPYGETTGQSKPKKIRNLKMRYVGHAALDPYFGVTSAARGAMFLTHIGQAPVIEGNEPRRVMTGAEMNFADTAFDIRIPKDCTILNVIRKYPTGIGRDSIQHNPVTTIIYEDFYDEFKQIGVLHVPEYMADYHQTFGFKLEKNREAWENIRVDEMVPKDTVLARSTTVKKDGLLGMGINLNAAFYSGPGTIEDGFIISEEILDSLTPRAYTTATGGCGRKSYFLNMYGDDTVYKPFPDIGEKIRADGVIFAVRDHDDDLSPAEMTPRALRELDRTFDRAVIGDPGGTIKDIKVYMDERQNPSYIPMGMDGQLRKYYDALCNYYREIIKVYRALQSRRKDRLRITEEFSSLIVEAMIYLPQADSQRKLTRTYRLDTLDECRLEITYETLKRPGGAFKLTDFHGGKGVICKTRPRAMMPRDKWGNICDVGIFGGSTMRRSNYGRIYEHGFGAASRDLSQRLRVEAGLDRHAKLTLNEVKTSPQIQDNAWIEYAFAELQDFYAIITVDMHEILKTHPDKRAYVCEVLKDGFSYIYSPIEDEVHLPKAMTTLINSRFCPNYDTVTYTDQAGNVRETKDKVLIGPLYMMLLEKIGDDWSSVASVKVQQFGLPSKLNNSDRSSTPGRETAIRSFGESETRSYNCTVGPVPTLELLDQTNNPQSHKAVIEALLSSEFSSNIERAVDREKIPYGNSRPVNLFDHLLECADIRLVYAPSHN